MKIFRLLVQTTGEGKNIASERISNEVHLSRGAVVSHLNRMIASGVAIRQDNRYELRMNSIEKMIDEIENDVCRVLQNVKEVARDVDERLGLRYRS
jgi:predicted transcriptional regulator